MYKFDNEGKKDNKFSGREKPYMLMLVGGTFFITVSMSGS